MVEVTEKGSAGNNKSRTTRSTTHRYTMHIENGRADLKRTKKEPLTGADQSGDPRNREEKTDYRRTVGIMVRAVNQRDIRRTALTAVLSLAAVGLLFAQQDALATLAIALAGFATAGGTQS
jgi:hypothetical protein